MKKKTLLALKALLFWATSLIASFIIACIDSLYDYGYFLHAWVIILILIGACYVLLSEEDIKKITLYNYLIKKIKE